MKKLLIILFSCACTFGQAQDYYITTIAGIDTFGYSGDGGPDIDCKLYYPEAINLDKRGNLYIADLANERIRKINLITGTITTVAGNGDVGYIGDNIPATNAELKAPEDVFTDTFGNIFFADALNNRIRKITVSTGIITTIAGIGTPGRSGDGGPATNAELNEPSGVCLDKAGNIYIADYANNVIRKVDAATGIMTTVAGTGAIGYSGDNGTATNAEFNMPEKVSIDSFNNIYISDQWNHVVRKVNAATGIITTIAGTGTAGYSGDGSLAVNAKLSQPGGLFVDEKGNVLVAEYGNGVIRKIDGATGIISTIAGTGVVGYSGDGGPATDAQLWPDGVILDSNGIMYIADYENNRIRMLYNPLAVKPIVNSNETLIFPNPAHDELTIENAANTVLYLYDLIGREIYKSTLTSNKETVDISNLPNGVYVAVITDTITGYKETKKIIKE